MENPMIAKIKKLSDPFGVPAQATASYGGVAVKEIGLLAIVVVSTIGTWIAGYATPAMTMVAGIGGLITCFAISFKPDWAGFLAPLYAILEGMFLACISAFAESMYPGLVVQAVLLTFGIAMAAAFVYSRGIVKVTGTFMKVVSMALLGLIFCYLGEFVLSFFGISFDFLRGGVVGIAIDLAVIGLATACLFIDYEVISQAVEQRLPKDYEWYCAFSLLVSLVWLYVRLLDLLMSLNNSRD